METIAMKKPKNKSYVKRSVFCTDNYNLFKFGENNRCIDYKHIKQLKEDIKKNGQLQPIIINKKHIVIDGQHRLQACKMLGIPVEYIQRDDFDMKECMAMNASSKNWQLDDYIHYYASKGNKNYISLEKLRAEYCGRNGLPKSIVFFALTHGKDGGFGARTIKGGHFIASRPVSEAKELLSYLSLINDKSRNDLKAKGSYSKLMTCLAEAYFYEDVDNDLLLNKLTMHTSKLEAFAERIDICRINLSRLYNLNRRTRREVDFEKDHEAFIGDGHAKTR